MTDTTVAEMLGIPITFPAPAPTLNPQDLQKVLEEIIKRLGGCELHLGLGGGEGSSGPSKTAVDRLSALEGGNPQPLRSLSPEDDAVVVADPTSAAAPSSSGDDSGLREKVEALQAEVADLQAENDRLKGRADVTEEDLSNLKGALDANAAEEQRQGLAAAALKSQVSKLRGEVEAAATDAEKALKDSSKALNAAESSKTASSSTQALTEDLDGRLTSLELKPAPLPLTVAPTSGEDGEGSGVVSGDGGEWRGPLAALGVQVQKIGERAADNRGKITSLTPRVDALEASQENRSETPEPVISGSSVDSAALAATNKRVEQLEEVQKRLEGGLEDESVESRKRHGVLGEKVDSLEAALDTKASTADLLTHLMAAKPMAAAVSEDNVEEESEESAAPKDEASSVNPQAINLLSQTTQQLIKDLTDVRRDIARASRQASEAEGAAKTAHEKTLLNGDAISALHVANNEVAVELAGVEARVSVLEAAKEAAEKELAELQALIASNHIEGSGDVGSDEGESEEAETAVDDGSLGKRLRELEGKLDGLDARIEANRRLLDTKAPRADLERLREQADRALADTKTLHRSLARKVPAAGVSGGGEGEFSRARVQPIGTSRGVDAAAAAALAEVSGRVAQLEKAASRLASESATHDELNALERRKADTLALHEKANRGYVEQLYDQLQQRLTELHRARDSDWNAVEGLGDDFASLRDECQGKAEHHDLLRLREAVRDLAQGGGFAGAMGDGGATGPNGLSATSLTRRKLLPNEGRCLACDRHTFENTGDGKPLTIPLFPATQTPQRPMTSYDENRLSQTSALPFSSAGTVTYGPRNPQGTLPHIRGQPHVTEQEALHHIQDQRVATGTPSKGSTGTLPPLTGSPATARPPSTPAGSLPYVTNSAPNGGTSTPGGTSTVPRSRSARSVRPHTAAASQKSPVPPSAPQ